MAHAHSLLSPFGVLLAEVREGKTLSGPAHPGPTTAPSGRPEPELHIETRVVSAPRRLTPEMGSWLWPASLLFHAALIGSVVIVPLLRPEALPAPAHETRAFFAGPALLAPPPPPPAAPAAVAPRSASRPPVRPATPATPSFTAPVHVPEPSRAETAETAHDGLALPADDAPQGVADGVAGGVEGGVAGGVPGGVVGGVLGGVVAAAPPAPIVPVRVGGEIKEPRKLRDVRPVYPELAVAANVKGTVVLECMVSPQGRVTEVKLVRGVPLLNTSAMEAVRQWMYTPTLKDGVPVPVILTVTVRFDL